MTTTLTPTQQQVLTHAVEHTDGKLIWFPDTIKGGARTKVIDGLFNRALITGCGVDWHVAAEGYDAMGLPRPGVVAIATPKEPVTNPRTRENSKQAQVLAMLQRPSGATIAEISAATGWQQHTVRGTFAGAFKKKLGLTITSTKDSGAVRVYRIS